jgi:MFS transporter, DHA3 family, macrolide efflux protein
MESLAVLILKPLRVKAIAVLWSGLALSAIGDELHRVALVWLLVELIGQDAGYVSALQFAAVLAVSLFSGIFADRWDQRRTMIGADLARSALAFAPVAALLIAPLNLYTLIPAAVLVSSLRGLFDPLLQASLPRLVKDHTLLPPTNALLDATKRIARLVGPLLGGILGHFMAPLQFFTVDALTFLASAIAIWSLRDSLPKAEPSRKDLPVDLDLGRAWRSVTQRPAVAVVLLRGFIVNGLWYLAIGLALVILIDQRNLSASGLSGFTGLAMIMASYGAGNVIANLVVSNLHPYRPFAWIFAGNALVGLGLLLMGICSLFAPTSLLIPGLMLLAAITALGGPISDIPKNTLWQTAFAPDEVAPVYRLVMAFDYGGMLIAMLVAPTLLNFFPSALVILGSGTGILVSAASGYWAVRTFEGRSENPLLIAPEGGKM